MCIPLLSTPKNSSMPQRASFQPTTRRAQLPVGPPAVLVSHHSSGFFSRLRIRLPHVQQPGPDTFFAPLPTFLRRLHLHRANAHLGPDRAALARPPAALR